MRRAVIDGDHVPSSVEDGHHEAERASPVPQLAAATAPAAEAAPPPPLGDAVILTVQACCCNVIAGYAALPLLCAAAGAGVCSAGGPPGPELAASALLLGTSAQALATWLLVGAQTWSQLAGARSWPAAVVLQGGAGGAAAAAAVAVCSMALFGADGASGSGHDAMQLGEALGPAALTPAQVGALVVSDVLLTPLVEEGIFRGALLRTLLACGTSVPTAVALQACAFAAYHLDGPHAVPLFALGCVLGATFTLSGQRLAASVVAHALYNSAAVALLLLPRGIGGA